MYREWFYVTLGVGGPSILVGTVCPPVKMFERETRLSASSYPYILICRDVEQRAFPTALFHIPVLLHNIRCPSLDQFKLLLKTLTNFCLFVLNSLCTAHWDSVCNTLYIRVAYYYYYTASLLCLCLNVRLLRRYGRMVVDLWRLMGVWWGRPLLEFIDLMTFSKSSATLKSSVKSHMQTQGKRFYFSKTLDVLKNASL